MALFKNITIKDFRGFEQVTISNLSQINVFLGKNNSGKSTILEAIFLLTGMSNPDVPNRINRLRTMEGNSMEQFKYLFHNINFQNHPKFEANLFGEEYRYLELSPLYNMATSGGKVYPDSSAKISTSSETSSNITGIKSSFKTKKGTQETKEYENSLTVLPDGTIRNSIDENYKETINAIFIPTDKRDLNASMNYAELVKKQKKEFVIESLKRFDNKIQSVEVLPDDIYLGMEGMEELLPVSMAGDGMRRFITIISSIANPSNKIILIDEIDNGLHHTAYKLLWKNIFNMAITNDVQLFITTHNWETLVCLKDVLADSSEKEQESLRVYTVEKTKLKGMQAYEYSYEGLKGAIEKEIELRS